MKQSLLLFGSSGALGSAIEKRFLEAGWQVDRGTREGYDLAEPCDAVIFGQGLNTADTIANYSEVKFLELFQANVGFIMEHSQSLVQKGLLKSQGKILIITSLWEMLTRQDKLSYSVTKAAVGGLVRSMAVDLGRSHQILVNAIAPGIVDSPMARNGLTAEQLEYVHLGTPGGRMVTPDDVAKSAYMLVGPDNTAISGQRIVVDYGFTISRIM